MSWELTGAVLRLRNLTPTEKAVAHSLAYHAPKNGSAHPSMATIALEAGLGSRRAAILVVRRLEAKGVISATTSKKGGRKNPTRYQFNSESPFTLCPSVNSEPGGAISIERVNTDALKSESPFTRDSSKTEKQQQTESESAAAAVSQEQMESELQTVWNYYIDAFGKEEIISPARKKMGLAILARLKPDADRVNLMACAIDMAHYIVKRDSKKAYFSKWTSIFGRLNTFVSLCEDHGNTPNVPEVAHLGERTELIPNYPLRDK